MFYFKIREIFSYGFQIKKQSIKEMNYLLISLKIRIDFYVDVFFWIAGKNFFRKYNCK